MTRSGCRKSTRYWDAANTQSEIIDVLPIGSPNAALNLYETGVADIVWDKDLVPMELLDVLTKRPDFHTFDYLGTYFTGLTSPENHSTTPACAKRLLWPRTRSES